MAWVEGTANARMPRGWGFCRTYLQVVQLSGAQLLRTGGEIDTLGNGARHVSLATMRGQW